MYAKKLSSKSSAPGARYLSPSPIVYQKPCFSYSDPAMGLPVHSISARPPSALNFSISTDISADMMPFDRWASAVSTNWISPTSWLCVDV